MHNPGMEITDDNELRGAFRLDMGGGARWDLAEAFRALAFNLAVASSRGPVKTAFIQFEMGPLAGEPPEIARMWNRIADSLAPEGVESPEVAELRAERDELAARLAAIQRAL